MKSKNVRVIVGVVVVLIVAFLVVRSLSRESFTVDKWVNATPEMRTRLMDSLAKSGVLVGLAEEEIYEMLGTPDGQWDREPPKIWYTKRYYDASGELKKRYAGISKCLYIEFRDQHVVRAEFTGS